MRFKTFYFTALSFLATFLLMGETTGAQQYKLRQVNTTMGMKSESTIYVKGMRKRTEGGGYMGMTQLTSIEQCDLQRTIKINEKKKLYYIEPFAEQGADTEETEVKPASSKGKPVASTGKQVKPKTGGVITMYYNILDTGERKKVYGLTARRLWTTQRMVPSPDACTMKDSMIIKTDGWYIDLPEFNCPVRYTAAQMSRPTTANQPQCTDRFVSRRSGKGKPGFAISETKTMIMGNGSSQTTKFESTIETLEFSGAKLDSMLFEIPSGYKQAKNEEELNDDVDLQAMMQQAGYSQEGKTGVNHHAQKKQGTIRIGVYEPAGDELPDAAALQQHIVIALSNDKVQAVAVGSAEAAKESGCELVLATNFTKMKQGNKIGGLLKAIKNTDPAAASSFQVEAELLLSSLSDGSTRLQEKINGKYEGKAQAAASRALDEGCNKLLEGL